MNTLTYYKKLDKLIGKMCMTGYGEGCPECVLHGKRSCFRISHEIERIKLRDNKRKLHVQ